MVDEDELDMEDPLVKFCTSTFVLQLSDIGIPRVVKAWNAHEITGIFFPKFVNICCKLVSTA